MASKTKLDLDEHNAGVYMDIAQDMFDKKKGTFTFVVRINAKKIVDYVKLETVPYGGNDN